MKSLFTLFALLMTSLLASERQEAAAAEAIVSHYNKMTSVKTSGGAPEALDLLREITREDQKSVTSFSVGIGPKTQDGILLHAIVYMWENLSKATAEFIRENDPEWMKCMVKSEGHDNVSLVRQLNGENLLIRVVALLKVGDMREIDKDISAALLALSKNDTYFQVEMRSVPSSDGRPPLPGLHERLVVAPLRRMAAKELQKRENKAYEEVMPSDDEAALWFSDLDFIPGLASEDIKYALSRISAEGPRMRELRQAAVEGDDLKLDRLKVRTRNEVKPIKQ